MNLISNCRLINPANLNNKLSSWYVIINKNNQGSFSSIYNIYNHKSIKNILLKIEKKNKKKKELCILNELKIYKKLILNDNYKQFIPILFDYFDTANYYMLTLENAGISLNKILEQSEIYNLKYYENYDIKYNILDNLMLNLIFHQGLQILNFLHSNNIIHRDIKPDNFVLKNNCLKIIDFGLSIENNKSKIDENLKFIGTARYCSVNVYNGSTHTFKDDLESFLFVIIYLINGYLPWQMGLKYDFFKKATYNKHDLLKYVNNIYLKNNINKLFNLIDSDNLNINYISILNT